MICGSIFETIDAARPPVVPRLLFLLYICILSTSLKDLQPGFETIWYENTTHLGLTHVYSLIWNLLFTLFDPIIHSPFSWKLCFLENGKSDMKPRRSCRICESERGGSTKGWTIEDMDEGDGPPTIDWLVGWLLRFLCRFVSLRHDSLGAWCLCIIG